MKNLRLKMSVSMGVGVLLLAAAATALSQTHIPRYRIPFAFVAGDKLFPAGDYDVKMISGFPLMDLKPANQKLAYRLQFSHRVERKETGIERGVLRFLKYDDHTVLQAVWSPWRTEGFELHPANVVAKREHPGIGSSAATIELQAK